MRVPSRENGDISRDGRSITYHLVHNARWSDGVALTSADVKFTFTAIVDPRNNVANLDPYDQIARVETPDPYTVRLVLKRPYAPALDAFSDKNQGAIVPAHLLRGTTDLNHAPFGGSPVGSGPYTLVAWRRGSEIALAANANYFRGPPKIANVVIRFLTNDNTMMVALRTGELDLADNINISTYEGLGNAPGLAPAIVPKSFWEHLTFNTSRPPLDDVRVRRALCEAFDVHELFEKSVADLVRLGRRRKTRRRRGTTAASPSTRSTRRLRAKLLDAAGWRLGPDGKRVKDGKPLEITLISTAGNSTREQMEVILQQRWAALGIDVAVKNFPAATIFAPMSSGGPFYGGNYDVALSAFIDNTPDPNHQNTNSADHIPPHGNNLSRYRNAELTQLEAQAAATFVTADRKRLYDRIQEIEVCDLPYYVLRWQAQIDLRGANLQGVKPATTTSTFWNIADWTLRQGRGRLRRRRRLGLGPRAVLEAVDAGDLGEHHHPCERDDDRSDAADDRGRHRAQPGGDDARLDLSELSRGVGEHRVHRRYPSTDGIGGLDLHEGGADDLADRIEEAGYGEHEHRNEKRVRDRKSDRCDAERRNRREERGTDAPSQGVAREPHRHEDCTDGRCGAQKAQARRTRSIRCRVRRWGVRGGPAHDERKQVERHRAENDAVVHDVAHAGE